MESKKRNSLIIIPYFGETPEWINYFIQSCSWNKEYDWLIYGNLKIAGKIPGNILVVKAEIQDFNKLASIKLGFPVDIRNPYKICDFRPTFPIIFSEYIKQVNFWGYGDLDLIFGNISDFIHPDDLSKYDVITTKSKYFAGHFTLFRNNNILNNQYKQIHRIKSILQDHKKFYSIDEVSNYIGQRFPGSKKGSYIKTLLEGFVDSIRYRIIKRLPILQDVTAVMKAMEKTGEIKVLHLNAIQSDYLLLKNKSVSWKYEWNKGILTNYETGEKIMYFHFIITKKNPYFNISTFLGTQKFIISRQGIHC